MASQAAQWLRIWPPVQETGGLPSMGSQRVRHDWVTNAFTFIQLPGVEHNDLTFVHPCKMTNMSSKHLSPSQLQISFFLWCKPLEIWASQMGIVVKNLPVSAVYLETQAWSLGQEEPLAVREGLATHSNILA